jgi:Ankyrin repeats (many copies)
MSDRSSRPVPAQHKLPPRANLEHLKNEAKEALRDLRRTNAAARLSDAQVQLARSYGFQSWRALKAYVDSLRGFGPQMIKAVRLGDAAAVRRILDHYPELVNATADLDREAHPSDTLAMRLTHLAIAENRGNVLRLLIERGADLNARNADGRLPLHDCFELDREHLVPALIEGGAVHDVCSAAVYGQHDRLREILDRDPSQANDLTTGESPIGWSIYGRQAESARILFRHGAVIDRSPYDEKAWRAVSMVAGAAMARVLLENGANANWRDANGETALHRVIKSRLVTDPAEFIAVLLEAGADPNLRNAEGRTALDEALRQQDAKAETYFPVRTIGPKRLKRSIEMLRSRTTRQS